MITMSTHGTPDSRELPKHNHERINRLVVEVEKLVVMLEEQRLVDPSRLFELKRELKAMEQR